MNRYKIAVIGGGPAGYVAAIKASQLGASVALVEADQLGGTCLNYGCIPTKTLLHNADIIQHLLQAKERGIKIVDPNFEIDMPLMMRQKSRVIKKLTTGVRSLLKSYGVTVIEGKGTIAADLTITVDHGETLSAESIILATGSESIRPSIPGAESKHVLTSRELLELQSLPKSLAIIGGGVIGVEMARIFNAFGVQVTLIELLDRLCPFLDHEISAELTKSLNRDGIAVHTGTRVDSIEEIEQGIKITTAAQACFEAGLALVSVGRRPNLSAIAGLDIRREHSAVWTDAHMQTSIPGVYAPGDVNAQCMLAHAAFKMAEIAVQNALGENHAFSSKLVPGIIYGHPEVAYVGLTEEQANATGKKLLIGRFPFVANGRALTANHATGFVKIIADEKCGEILGVHMIGPLVSELINEAVALISAEGTIHKLAETVHGHPTCSEALMEAAADALGMCVHLPKKC